MAGTRRSSRGATVMSIISRSPCTRLARSTGVPSRLRMRFCTTKPSIAISGASTDWPWAIWVIQTGPSPVTE